MVSQRQNPRSQNGTAAKDRHAIAPALLVAAFIIAGCSTLPAERDVDKTRALAMPFDVVWQNLVEVLAEVNMPLKSVTKDSGLIVAERLTFDDRFADCGSRALFPLHGRRVDLNVFVGRDGPDKVTVRVNAGFTEIRGGPWGRIDRVQCVSRGLVEQVMLEAARDGRPGAVKAAAALR